MPLDWTSLDFIYQPLQAVPSVTAVKWLFMVLICLAILVFLALEQRKLQKYYQRLAAHATSHDTAALDYSLKLLSVSTRNKLFFSLSFVILTLSVVFYDLKQQHFERMTLITEQDDYCKTLLKEVNEETPILPSKRIEPSELHETQPVQVKNKTQHTPTAANQNQDIDTLKIKHEKLWLNYFILEKCAPEKASKYRKIEQKLRIESKRYPIEDINEFIAQTRSAADGTFEELYKGYDCNNGPNTPLEEGLKNYFLEIERINKSDIKN